MPRSLRRAQSAAPSFAPRTRSRTAADNRCCSARRRPSSRVAAVRTDTSSRLIPALVFARAGPPVEEGAGPDGLGLLHERQAALGDDLVQILDDLEVAVYERLVDEGPQMLGRLQLWTVGGLEDEPNTIRHGEVLRSVPAGVVELQHDALARPGVDRFGEVGEHELEVSLADAVGNVPDRTAGDWLDEPGDVEPLEAMMRMRNGTLTDRRPHAARDRLQTDAMLIRRPDLDLGTRMLAPLIGGGALQFFLSAHDPARSPPADVADAAAGSTSRSPQAHPNHAGRAPT